MHKYFEYPSKLDSFHIFSIEHLAAIGIILFLSVLLFVFKRFFEKNQNIFRWSMAVLMCIFVFWYHFWLLYEKAWSLQRDLPLQLSDIAVILSIFLLLTRNEGLFQFLYYAGLASSIQAILTPDLGRFSFPHFQFIEFFVTHGGVVLACLFMTAVLEYLPRFYTLWITILIVNVYALFVFFLNKWCGANYLYIMKKPAGPSLLNFLGPWPWYLISMEIVTATVFLILYLPFWMNRQIS